MARSFTTDERELLRSPDLQVNVLATFFLDEGTYRFCDEGAYDLMFDGDTYIGASAILGELEFRAARELAAEQVVLTIDGNRMAQAGIDDPAAILIQIMDYLYQQRRVDFAFGFRYSYSQDVNLYIPASANKINTVKLIDESIDLENIDEGPRSPSKLEIVLDSLAIRYRRASHRTRSHNDQLEIDPTDRFYSFTVNVRRNERKLYWGKAAPYRTHPPIHPRSPWTGGGGRP